MLQSNYIPWKSYFDIIHDAGFEEYFYENLAIGARIGGKIDKLEKRS